MDLLHSRLQFSLEPGSLPALCRIENKKGSLVHFNHMLDMVGRGLESIDHSLQDQMPSSQH